MLRTKNQERNICGECPIAKTANLVGDTFMLLIIRDLLSGPKRFTEIEASLFGVSSRTVTKKLKILKDRNLVKRSVISERPPRVEYSLTKNGKALQKITNSMREYGSRYL